MKTTNNSKNVNNNIVEGTLYLVPNRPRTFNEMYWDFQREEVKSHLENLGIKFQEEDLFIETSIWTVDGEKELTYGWGIWENPRREPLPDCMPISFLQKFKEGDVMVFVQNNKEYRLKIDHLSHYKKYGPFEEALNNIPAQWDKLMKEDW